MDILGGGWTPYGAAQFCSTSGYNDGGIIASSGGPTWDLLKVCLPRGWRNA
jgi:hypothetical protein